MPIIELSAHGVSYAWKTGLPQEVPEGGLDALLKLQAELLVNQVTFRDDNLPGTALPV